MLSSQTQPVLPLHAGLIPKSRPSSVTEVVEQQANGSLRISNVVQPTLTVFRPARPNGTAIIICPGGGYARLAIDHEGYDVARQLTEWGVTAFVLKYRLPDDASQTDKSVVPLLDAQQALRLVRQRATGFGVQPGQVGLMGFSAGGHLAATAGTRFTGATDDTQAGTSLRPDFLVLLYPVISFTDNLTHAGSRNRLLGEKPTTEQIEHFSTELHVTPQTPPAFLIHAQDDAAVDVRNSLRFYEACVQQHVPAEMHLYPRGGHGFGMHNPTTPDQWMDRLRNWLAAGGWLR
ncbi:alpha/beta hydrolase [Hymenobacter perfusus]|uniref:Alpha/beta hydrolase n=1 Tax=Hymenobacter perfusus TaxID=1236770 RepID=A0A428K3D6_9BACT|nr:alpha/beta hydrolase [Hymenobacter perfusus]RSK40938.1 alpha/beta hydrolase [Hymenobacter perfusus]